MEKQKPTNENLLSYFIETRVKKAKYEELQSILKQARGIRSLSHLLRTILENKPITVLTYDTTYDKVLNELAAIRTELRAIGININQVTRSFHQEKRPDERLVKALEITKLFQQADQKITELFTIISNLATRWSPK